MTKEIREYFVCANAAQGFVNYFPQAMAKMDRVYILKGGPGTGKSTLMKKIGEAARKKGEITERIYCSSDPQSLDGIVLSGRKTAVADGTAPHVLEPSAPGAVEEYVNLGVAWDSGMLASRKKEIFSLKEQIAKRYDRIYRLLAEGKTIHDKIEDIYIENTNFARINEIAESLAEEIIGPGSGTGASTDRFFGALAPKGSINFLEALTEPIAARYFIKGKPGTGKSTLMKTIAEAAQQEKIDTELYHCAFDADSLDMVILRERKACIFDVTAPHEIFPCREGDILIDLYQEAVRPGTDERYASDLERLDGEYEDKIRKARGLLKEIKTLHDRLEEIYIGAVDFSIIEQITADLMEDMGLL